MDKGLDFVLGQIKQLSNTCEGKSSDVNLESEVNQAPITPRERIQELLLDDYSVKLYEMTDDQLNEEYEDRIGDRRLL